MKRILSRLTAHGARSLSMLTCSCLLANMVNAQDFETGWAAHQRGDYETAVEVWQVLAEEAEIKAQKFLVVMHEAGNFVPQDTAKALYWYKRAAAQGDVSAQIQLGNMYRFGRNVPKMTWNHQNGTGLQLCKARFLNNSNLV